MNHRGNILYLYVINEAGALRRQIHTAEHSSFASWCGSLTCLSCSFFHSDYVSRSGGLSFQFLCETMRKFATLTIAKPFSSLGSTSYYYYLQISQRL